MMRKLCRPTSSLLVYTRPPGRSWPSSTTAVKPRFRRSLAHASPETRGTCNKIRWGVLDSLSWSCPSW